MSTQVRMVLLQSRAANLLANISITSVTTFDYILHLPLEIVDYDQLID